MKPKYLRLIFFLCFLPLAAAAQIIDDSTRQVYGVHSTKFILEEEIRENDTVFAHVDSLLLDLENFEVIKSSDIYYQDLGVNGTAMIPMYYAVPTTIGRVSGFSAYDAYATSASDLKYYNTKSPFMDLKAAFGGAGRSMVDFSFSRNVNPNWNVGFDIKKLSSNRQIGEVAFTSNNNNARSSTLDIYTYYTSDHKKYTLLFHALRFEHEVRETGGISPNTPEEEYFEYANTPVSLSNSVSKDTRVNFHAYQEYSLKPFLEVYHVFDKKSAKNEFNVFPLARDAAFYDQVLIRSDSTVDAAAFNELSNELGVKGKLSDKLFYGAYLKRRDISFRYVYSEPFGHTGENYLGGDMKFFINETNTLGGKIEVLDGGQYYLRGFLDNKYLRAVYTSAIYSPSFLSEAYQGNHHEWQHDFDAVIVNSIAGSARYDFKFLTIEPKVSVTSIDEYVYFNTDKVPAQSNAAAIINRYSVRADLRLGKHFRLNNDINYTILGGAGADVFRVPDLLINSKWYYEGVWFNNYMPVQFGFNIRFQSAYYGHAYDPSTQQYYLQNDFKMKSYAAADLFLNFQARNFSLFAKMTHINQFGANGYFASPLYPGQKRVFDIGCRWLFFD